MEEKVYKLTNQVVSIEQFGDFEKIFTKLVKSISPNYQNITQVDLKGVLVKYGVVDLTYIEMVDNTYLRLFGKTDKCGVTHFQSLKDKNKDFKSYFLKHLENVDLLFPLEITIKDCCKTDNPKVWDKKYFYS